MLRGVDVSEHQPQLDWASLAADGCRFAFIRLGDGNRVREDSMIATHRADAKAARMLVGGYWFCRDSEDPAAQARHYLDLAEQHGPWDFVPCPDWEQHSREGYWAPEGNWLAAVLDTIRARHPGRSIPVYCDWYGLRDLLAGIHLDDCVLWIPGGSRYNASLRWADEPGPLLEAPPGRRTGIWQFTQYGRAGSYRGDLDLNLAEPWAIDALTGRSTVTTPAARFVAAAQAWVSDTSAEQPPGSNNVPGITDCTGPTFWCFNAVWRWSEDAGLGLPRLNGSCGITYCPSAVEHAYRSGEAVNVGQAKAGDIVIFSWEPWSPDSEGIPRCTAAKWNGAVAGDHVGIVEHDYDGSGWLHTIEGNTSNDNDTDGIYVARRHRHVSLVCCVWRPPVLRSTAPAPVAPPFPDTAAAPGEAGPHVEALQRWLTARARPDLNPGTIDSYYGSWTTVAVKNLQRIVWGAYASSEADGVWGALTIARVRDHLAGLPITEPPPSRHEPTIEQEDQMILVRADDAPTSPDPLAPQAIWLVVGDRKMWVPDGDSFQKLGGAAAVKAIPWVLLNQIPAMGQVYSGYAGPMGQQGAAVDTKALAAAVGRSIGAHLQGMAG